MMDKQREEETGDGESGVGLSVRPISPQLREHSNFNLRPNSPPLSTEIANMVLYLRECKGIWCLTPCVCLCVCVNEKESGDTIVKQRAVFVSTLFCTD